MKRTFFHSIIVVLKQTIILTAELSIVAQLLKPTLIRTPIFMAPGWEICTFKVLWPASWEVTWRRRETERSLFMFTLIQQTLTITITPWSTSKSIDFTWFLICIMARLDLNKQNPHFVTRFPLKLVSRHLLTGNHFQHWIICIILEWWEPSYMNEIWMFSYPSAVRGKERRPTLCTLSSSLRGVNSLLDPELSTSLLR